MAFRQRGGHAVPYVEGDEGFDLAGFADRISRVIAAECASLRLPVPRLVVEPGRAIVNRAMVTLHRILAVKHVIGCARASGSAWPLPRRHPSS
jgi:diaminopimelate decarboxylase